ncbi:MAG: Holliday junction DNA helicase RuvB C-terminal domain-containing protein [bacterium]
MEEPQFHETGPGVLEHFVGQARAVEQARTVLEATWTTTRPLPHLLLLGPSGTGKTELAQILAKERPTRLHQALGQNLADGRAVAALLLRAEAGDAFLIDEAHELRPAAQVQLYRAIAEYRVFLSGGPFGREPAPVQVPPFTLIAATTDEFALQKPLRSRFEVALRFTYYSKQELVTILQQRATRMHWPVDEVVLHEIAQRAHGVPRLALNLLKACQRTVESHNEDRITRPRALETFAREGIDPLGLNPDERRYLELLAVSRRARLSTLAARMDLPHTTLARVLEPPLIRLGLIERQADSQRIITAAGLAHLAAEGDSSRPIAVP